MKYVVTLIGGLSAGFCLFAIIVYASDTLDQEDSVVSHGGIADNSKEQSVQPILTQTHSVDIVDSLPESTYLSIPTHAFQTFNNCGPASLSMMLSYFDIYKTQQELGNELRPYQVPSGIHDDKSVSLEELAQKATEYGLVSYHRPSGDIDMLKKLLANDMPVLTRTWTEVNEDIGHYRVVKGYDDSQGVIIQDDSLQGKDLSISYDDFMLMWEKFNFEYVVLTTEENDDIARAILAEHIDEQIAWQQARENAQALLAQNPDDIYARFNVSVALYHLGDYEGSVREFERVESQLPFRTLWYQIEPLLAYQQLKQYNELLPRIERILSGENRAYSELYHLRGQVYLDQGNPEAAREQFELALIYNNYYKPSQQALNTL